VGGLEQEPTEKYKARVYLRVYVNFRSLEGRRAE
jgi:hypothetical protein